MELDYKTTQEVVKEMLLENTGSHFLDSGQAFGYQYEKRAARKFEEEPKGTYEVALNDKELVIIPRLNIYHALVDNFEWDQTFTEMLQIYGSSTGYGSWGTDLAENFAGKIGAVNINTYNTYNFDNFLEANLLVTNFTVAENMEDYAIISTHNGCDARGGYSDAKVFYAGGMTDSRLEFEMTRAFLECPDLCDDNPADLLYSDSGWSIRLNKEDIEDFVKNETPVKGKYTITSDNDLYCKCGKRLEVYFG